MIDNGDFFNKQESGQLTLSYELLCLLRWLVEHDADHLKNMVANAIKSGLKNELQRIDTISELHLVASGVEDAISDFIRMLELHLLEAMDQETLHKAKQNKLISDINKIDTSLCDNDTVRISLEKTTHNLEDNPDANPKEQLYKELLKQWQPHNKKVYN